MALDFLGEPTRAPAAAAELLAGRETFQSRDRLVEALAFGLKLGDHLVQVHGIVVPESSVPSLTVGVL